ncbi:MAG: Hsp33 family molecular chaperone HslO [Clostridiales bacterium]|nr:Hsp33 family molecular chaperone HslO [Clostridiales bacterium]
MNDKDQMIRITLADGMVRGLLLTATNTVAAAAAIHNTTPVATAAFGRTLMGTAMLGTMLKQDDASVTVTIAGGGPIGKIVCVADSKSVRGYVDVPNIQIPLRNDGKLNVGYAVGNEGRMSVVKDYGMKSPYIGQVELVSGEIAEDFASYYVQSEQTPTLQSLGVLTNGDAVLSAGGVLLQPMPDCPDSIIEQLEFRSPMFADISRELCYEPMLDLMNRWLDGLKPVVLETNPISYSCNCSRSRMEKALITLGKEELTHMIEDEQEGAELTCHFCKKQEKFTQHDLIRLLNKAQEK